MELKRNRYQTYAKRVKGLQKKIYEFSKLCTVDACMIVYGPKHGNHRPDMYPENLGDVIRIAKRYLSVPKEERTKRHISFFNVSGDDGKIKIEDDNSNESVSMKDDNNNNTAVGLEWDARFDRLSADQIQQLIDSVELKIETIEEKIQCKENNTCITGRVSDQGDGDVATTTISGSGDTYMQMQPVYVLQPFNNNLANNGSTMLPMGLVNGVTANGAYPMVMQYPMMAVRPSGDNNREEYGNHQGQVTYFVPQSFVQPMTTPYIPNLMPGGTSSDA